MSARSSYREVKQHVLGRIRSGEWGPGAPVPREHELAQRFGCARMTVHRALRELAEEGVLERRRRSGTRVALQTARSALVEIPRVDREIEATGARYHYRRLARRIVRPGAAAAAQLGLAPGARALRVTCLHHAGEVPFQLEERWINLDAVPEARDEPFTEQPPNVWLLERRPWSNVEHVIGAIQAGDREARRLAIDAGDALLLIERRTWLERQVLTWVRMLHPGRFYRLRAAAARD